MYNKLQSSVRVNVGVITDWFKTVVGIRQGCITSLPWLQLFNILVELVIMVMTYATCDSTVGIHIHEQNRMVIKINNTPLKQVENFIYTLEEKSLRSDPVLTMLNTKLGRHLVQCKISTTFAKIQLYKTLILSLYGTETWTLKRKTKIDWMYSKWPVLRKICSVSRLDKIRNTTIRKSLELKEDIIERIS